MQRLRAYNPFYGVPLVRLSPAIAPVFRRSDGEKESEDVTTREDVEPIFEKALQVIEIKEHVYGDAWKTCGKGACVSEVFRKANYIRVQWEKGRCTADEFLEDLLDLMNWSAYSYWYIEKETQK